MSKAVPLQLKPGQASIHSARVVHSSQPNRSDDRRIGFAIQSYMPPHVEQTIVPTYAQLVRGDDQHGNFTLTGRPAANMTPTDVALRDKVNKTWSDILYHGAKKRRNY